MRHTCIPWRIIIKNIFIIATVALLSVYGAISLATDFKNSSLASEAEDDVRVFCWQNRLFLEFISDRGTWGVQMLDSQGIPAKCPKKNQVAS